MTRLVAVLSVLLTAAAGCSPKPSAGTSEPTSATGSASSTTPAKVDPPPPKDLFSATSRRHLDTLLTWHNAHLPNIDDKPEKAPDETDAGYKRRLYKWQTDATNALQRYDKDMCLSITRINCPSSPLTKAMKAEGFRGEMECSVVDVLDLGHGGEVICSSRDDGKPEFTVVTLRVSELRKGELIRFSQLRLGGPSKRIPRLFSFRGNLPLEPEIKFERVAAR